MSVEKSLQTQKALVREHYRKIRRSIPAEERLQWNEAITALVLALADLRGLTTVFTYLSMQHEVSTNELVAVLLAQGKKIWVPSPDVRALPEDGLFQVGSGIMTGDCHVPVACREASISAIDAILVPGIAWDRNGYRVGFGGGYFDRLLSRTRPDCVKIGLAYQCQMVDDVPREPWDQRVDMVITEVGVATVQPKN